MVESSRGIYDFLDRDTPKVPLPRLPLTFRVRNSMRNEFEQVKRPIGTLYEKVLKTIPKHILDTVKFPKTVFIEDWAIKLLKPWPDLYSACYIFKQKLIFYFDDVKIKNIKPIVSWRDLVKYALSGLDEQIAYKDTVEVWIKSKLCYEEFDYAERVSPIEHFTVADQFYPAEHMLPWVQDELDESDIKKNLKWAFRVLEPIRKAPYKDLKNKMRGYIQKLTYHFNFDTLDEISAGKRTKYFDPKTGKKGKYSPILDGKTTNLSDIKRLNYMISKACKETSEKRIIPIGDVLTKNLHYHFRKLLKYTLQQVQVNSEYNFQPKDLDSKLTDSQSFFILIDLKKYGWSFPSELINLALELICEVNPEVETFQLMKECFPKRMYWIDNQWRKPHEGFTLGMMDDLASFILGVLWQEFMDEYQNNFKWDQIRARFKGDDSYLRIRTKSYGQAANLFFSWTKFLGKYNIPLNRDKSIIVKGSGIYLEKYGFNPLLETSKTYKYILNVFNSLKAPTIAGAKQYVAGLHQQIPSLLTTIDERETKRMMTEAINTVISIWGYEFTPYEHEYPIEFGGWTRHIDHLGLNEAIIFAERLYDTADKHLFNIINVKKPKTLILDNKKVKEYKKDKELVQVCKFFEGENYFFEESRYFTNPFRKTLQKINHKRFYVKEEIVWYNARKRAYNQKCLPIKKIIDKMMNLRNFKFKIPQSQMRTTRDEFLPITHKVLVPNEYELGCCNYKRAKAMILMENHKINPLQIKPLHKFKFGDLMFSCNRQKYLAREIIPIRWYNWAEDNGISYNQLKENCNEYGYDAWSTFIPTREDDRPRTFAYITDSTVTKHDCIIPDWVTGDSLYTDIDIFEGYKPFEIAKEVYLRILRETNRLVYLEHNVQDIIKHYWSEPNASEIIKWSLNVKFRRQPKPKFQIEEIPLEFRVEETVSIKEQLQVTHNDFVDLEFSEEGSNDSSNQDNQENSNESSIDELAQILLDAGIAPDDIGAYDVSYSTDSEE